MSCQFLMGKGHRSCCSVRVWKSQHHLGRWFLSWSQSPLTVSASLALILRKTIRTTCFEALLTQVHVLSLKASNIWQCPCNAVQLTIAFFLCVCIARREYFGAQFYNYMCGSCWSTEDPLHASSLVSVFCQMKVLVTEHVRNFSQLLFLWTVFRCEKS